jgi:hypothetical protein
MTEVIRIKRQGLPIDIAVETPNGADKVIHLFFEGSAEKMTDMIDRQHEIEAVADKIGEKYPQLKNDWENLSDDDAPTLLAGVSELMEEAYDLLFGEGTYKRLTEAGLGIADLVPLFDQLKDKAIGYTEHLADRLEHKSQQRKDKVLQGHNKKRRRKTKK